MKVLIGFSIVFLLAACQDKPKILTKENEQLVSSTDSVKVTKTTSTDLVCMNKSVIKKSPPVHDKSKIKAMLLKSGKITAEMTSEQADKIVNDFIRAKQTPNKNCK